MTSEIRTNSLKSRAGLSTVTLTDTGPMFSGITTFVDNSGFNIGTGSSIFSPAANTLTFGTNSNERLRITSDGIVDVTGKLRIDISSTGGVGSGNAEGIFLRNTNETDNNAVTIFGGADDYNAAASAINFINVDHSANYGDISFDTRGSGGYGEKLRITSTGRVGISSSIPTEALEVRGNIFVRGATTSDKPRIKFGFTNAVIQGGKTEGNVGTDHLVISGNGTRDDLVVNYAGNIGIGTNNPSKQLSIYGDSDTCIRVVSSAGGAASLQLGDTSDTVKGAITFLNSDNSLRIRGHNNTDRMVITSDGKLLLGTTDTGFSGSYTIMTVGNTSLSDSGITIVNSTTGIGRLHFADGNSSSAVYAGWIAYNHNSNSMLFGTNQSGTEKVTIDSNGRLSAITAATQINFGNTIGKGGFLLSTTDGQFAISGGGYWAGSNWVATASASTQIRHDGGTGAMNFCFNTGLTAGNNFTPTTRLEITPSGNMKLSDPGITFSDSSPYFPTAWSSTDGVNTTFTIASTTYANLRFRGEQTTGTEYTMGVGAGIFYMAYDDINNGHRITVAANGVVSLNVNDTSDEKMKKNITSLADGAIDRIKQLRPVNFDWKKDSDLNGQSGFIAQEIKTVIPDLVQGEEYVEGSIESVGYSVNTTGIVAHLTKAVQELITKVETLEQENKTVQELITKVETLEQDNIALRARVTNLEGN